MITTRTLTLTDEELATIVKAHDLMDEIDDTLFEHEEDDFFFDREEVSRDLRNSMALMEEAMIKLVGYTRWIEYNV